MRIQRIVMENFRNHESTTMEFGGRLNAILGDNGEGKTNVIEAISYLCLTRSFYAANDGIVLQRGKDAFMLRGEFVGDGGIGWSVQVQYDRAAQRKVVSVNGKAEDPLSAVVGKFPAVILSPEQNGITFGAPSERRRFMDVVISQSSKVYLEDLLEYRRILRQRNRLLVEARMHRRLPASQLEAWDEGLIHRGVNIMRRRRDFLEAVLPAVTENYGRLCSTREKPEVKYVPSFEVQEWAEPASLEELFGKALSMSKEQEMRTASTVIGPHRDDIDLRINGLEVKHFASQGQHKTFLIALKLAEFAYLRGIRQETPLFLLDDVFSELDEHRGRQVLELVEHSSQSFVTTTDERVFDQSSGREAGKKKFYVHRGSIVAARSQVPHEISG